MVTDDEEEVNIFMAKVLHINNLFRQTLGSWCCVDSLLYEHTQLAVGWKDEEVVEFKS